MNKDTNKFDFFVSYASADNTTGWVTQFVKELQAEHAKFFPGCAPLVEFFDKKDIAAGRDWEHTLHHGIAQSRLFLAFISPNYFASDWCRREWRAWIDTEISKHILTAGVRPVYLVEVPGFTGKGTLGEQAVAQKIAELCHLPAPYNGFLASAAPVVKQVRRRQLLSDFAKPFADEGLDALRRDDLHRVLSTLARDLDHHAQLVTAAASSETTVPPYNKKFSGRLDELLELRKRLKDDQAGVVCGVHGLGGIGKTELAFTYAHAFASAYPGGRFLIPCEGKESLRQAVLCLGDFYQIHPHIRDEERKTPETYFAAVARCLDARLADKGHILLVLDNVANTAFVSPQQTDCLTTLGPKLHLLATTRLLPPTGGNWLTLGELPEADALDLLEKHRPFADETERAAAGRIVKRLGGFALAVELVAAWLAAHPGSSYGTFADGLGLQNLENIASDQDVVLRRHNHERRLSAVLGSVLLELEPAERRALEYAALLPPDCVALPWLRELVGKDFPEVLQPTQLVADPWREFWQRLLRLALFSRVEGETSEPNVVRIHRLLQDLLNKARRSTTPEAASTSDADPLETALMTHLKSRSESLWDGWVRQEHRWEIGPLIMAAWQGMERGSTDGAYLANQLSQPLLKLGNFIEAKRLLQKAVAINEAAFEPNHPTLAIRYSNLALVEQALGNLPEAKRLLQKAVAINEAAFEPNHPTLATSYSNLALVEKDLGNLPEAKRLLQKAVAIKEAAFEPNHPTLATSYSILAGVEQALGNLPEAKRLLQKALAIDEAAFEPNHPTLARDYSILATVEKALGNLPEAKRLLQKAVAIDEAAFEPNHPTLATIYSNLALVEQDLGNLPEAKRLLQKAVAINEASLPQDHPWTNNSKAGLAIIQAALDKQHQGNPKKP